MDTQTPAIAAAPAVTLKGRQEKVKVTVGLDVTGFGPLRLSRSGSAYPLTLSAVTVVATLDGETRSVKLYAHGKNQWGVDQTGEWGLPHATRAPSYDSQSPYIGLITDLPRELLDAVEAAAGIRFADYVAPAEG